MPSAAAEACDDDLRGADCENRLAKPDPSSRD